MSEEKVIIFDTTLRDGEQSPGASLSIAEKLEIAQQLAVLGVDVIEAGFPVSSPTQFEATRLVAEQVEGATIAGLARANEGDIDSAGKALAQAKKKRIHTFIATSPVHMKHKLKKSSGEVLKMAVKAVKHAKSYTDDVEFSPEDACRSEMDFLIEVLTAVENVALPLLLMGEKTHNAQEKAKVILREVGLGSRLYNRPNEMSGGQRQRVAIARSLITNPQIILADEPTGDLSSVISKDIMKLFRRLNEDLGQTFVLVTHSELIGSLCDRIIMVSVLYDGLTLI